MMRLLSILLCMMALSAQAGNRYTYGTTSGAVTITPGSTSPALQHGDTLDIPSGAVYQSFSVDGLHGQQGDSIVIRWLGTAKISDPCVFCDGAWTDSYYVKVIGLNGSSNRSASIALWHGCHSIRFTGCNFTYPPGSYMSQPAIYIDDKYGSTMYFTGSKSQTFYDIRIDNSIFDGFQDVDAIRCGTDTTRSICLDIEIDHNIVRNFTSTAYVPYFLNSAGWRFRVHDNTFDGLLTNAGASLNHSNWIFHYGQISVYNNHFKHMRGQAMRLVPFSFTGLTGYVAYDSVYNNILDSANYSLCEVSPNNGYARYNRYAGYVIWSDSAWVVNNTVHGTLRANYNGDYAAMVIDAYPNNGTFQSDNGTPAYSPHIFVWNNVIVEPERDRTFDLATRGYIVYFGSGTSGFTLDTAGNKVIQTWAAAKLEDSITFRPTLQSSLCGGRRRTLSAYDKEGKPAAGTIGALAPFRSFRKTGKKFKLSS